MKLFATAVCLLVVVVDSTDGVEDAGCNSVAATNSILLSLVTERLKGIHDIELSLCDHDTAHIVMLLCTRSCDHSDYVLPPCALIRFRCYVRIVTPSHLVLTVVPATYDDMVAVMSMLDSLGSVVDSATDNAIEPSSSKNGELVADAANCNQIPTDHVVDMPEYVKESSVDQSSGVSQADAKTGLSTQSVNMPSDKRVTSNCPHNIRLPVFVFDCLLNLVSDQLVHHSSSDRPADIVEDFTYQVMTAVISAHLTVLVLTVLTVRR